MQDKVVLHKTSNIHHVLTVYREGKIIFRQQLSTKEFFKHDLIQMGIHYFLYGDIYTVPEKGIDIEFLAAALNKINEQDFDVETYILDLKAFYKESKKRFPKVVDKEFLKSLRTFVVRYISEYKAVKTGKSLEIIFKK